MLWAVSLWDRLKPIGSKVNLTTGLISMGFPGGSVVKNLSAIQEIRVLSLGWEDPLELPAKFFVLENAGIDGIIIAANEFGEVYQVQYDEHKKIHDSILAYLEWCLRES